MPDRIVQYEIDGEERWAIWSTVVDGFTWYDLTATEVIEIQAEKAAKSQRRSTALRILDIKNGENPYIGGGLPDEEDIEELKSWDHEG